MIDPTNCTVKQAKALGLWPSQIVAPFLTPYLKRIKRDIEILDIGVHKGENIVYLHENVPNIKTIYGLSLNADYESVLVPNMQGLTKVSQTYDGRQVDVVIAEMSESITAEVLLRYYEKVKVGGFFAGDKHEHHFTKDALVHFRRSAKVSTPVQVLDKQYWFWQRTH
jgi:ADP-heptose:LPS heptosyltransferase